MGRKSPGSYKLVKPTYFRLNDRWALKMAVKRVSSLSRYFAGLAIFISCLGLLALSSFTAERRIREIGIRKIMEASTRGIIWLLSADFTKLVLLAIIVAAPLSVGVQTLKAARMNPVSCLKE